MEMVISHRRLLEGFSDLFLPRFCPSVFFYLCTVVPSVWFLELDVAERRSKFNVTQALGLLPGSQTNALFDIDDTLPVKDTRFFVVLIVSFSFISACSMENSS